MDTQEKYLTLAEVAAHYRRSESSIRWWRQNSYGPRPVKVGKRLLYPVSEIVRFDAVLCGTLDHSTEEAG